MPAKRESADTRAKRIERAVKKKTKKMGFVDKLIGKDDYEYAKAAVKTQEMREREARRGKR